MRQFLKVYSLGLFALFLGFLAFPATATTYYVDINSPSPTPPYNSWATASTDIQSAVNLAVSGDLVLVNDGIYNTGGETVNGFGLTNRVAVTAPVTVQSVNGPATTMIEGYQDTNSGVAYDAIRCVYLTNNAVLSGFTLTNGATLASGDVTNEQSGGGVFCESTNVLVTNCVVTANLANNAGGAYAGTLVNCALWNNYSGGNGGGAVQANLNGCLLNGNSAGNNGGAVMAGALCNCTLTNNYANGSGGGTEGSALEQCTLTGNSAQFFGGGADSSTLNQCTLAGNDAGGDLQSTFASPPSGPTPLWIVTPAGGGAENSVLNNCSLIGNQSVNGGGADSSELTNCTVANNSGGNNGGGADNSTLDGCCLTNNSAASNGGGAESSTLTGCVLAGNTTLSSGGGADGSTLTNCTLTGNSAAQSGGGLEGSSGDNCTLIINFANVTGGGVDSSTLNNSAMANNSSVYNGGGAENSTLNNCTLTGNSALTGGGADSSTLNNCIAFCNVAPSQPNASASTLNYCCTTPLPLSGTNNITGDPQLTDTAHIGPGSPCIGAGSSNFSSGLDIDGQAWLNPPSIGCNEFYAGAATGPLSLLILAGYTNVATGFAVSFSGVILGHAAMDVWDFGDGTLVTNSLSLSHHWASPGNYAITLTAYNSQYPAGVSTTVFVQVLAQPTAYVAANNINPVPPYLTWATAATNIQDAVDAVAAGGTVWVTNGVYDCGGHVLFGTLTNRVALAGPITVRSVNGPSVTTIEGVPVIGDGAVRCAYVTNGAMLAGFTLANGATSNGGDGIYGQSGGGVLCQSSAAIVSNCVISASSAAYYGGGDYQGTLENCTLTGNQVVYYGDGFGGGADSAILVGCTLTNNLSYTGGGAENSALLDCTLTGNTTYIDSDYTANGGGAANSFLTNCVLSGNVCLTGAGACASTLVNCALTGNSTEVGDGVWPPNGGGACQCILINCSVLYNTANNNGGGVCSCILTNCMVDFNTAPNGTNYSEDSTLSWCDADPLAATNGVSNIDADPQLADLLHISANSPCRGAGTFSVVSGVDIDGDLWSNPPSIGCDEFNSASATGALAVAISPAFTNVATSFSVNFTALISGHATSNRWNFGDGTVVGNEVAVSHSWSMPGVYTVTFTVFNTDNPGGGAAFATLFVLENPVHYVSPSSANPEAPYLSWTTAATNIQDALNAAFAGGTVMVSNGVYQTGQTILYGTETNRVAVTRPLTLQSVNGSAATVIDGGNTLRCLYITNNVTVTGFTLQNGVANTGAGVYCEKNSILNYCVMTNNSSPDDGSGGGGASGGTLNHCTLVGNYANYLGSGAVGATLNFCALSNNAMSSYGGGACYCTLNDCLISSNAAAWGGGVTVCSLNDCLCLNNWAQYGGGGAGWSSITNSTIVGNNSGVLDGTINNSIVFNNNGANYAADFDGITFNNSCTSPDPGGFGNITNDPSLVNAANGNLRLSSTSPCINAGNNAFAVGATDLDGHARIVGGTVDIGAYEYQSPTSVISYAYLQQYGLPTDGSVDFADLDGTGLSLYQDWFAGLNPTNPASVLAMLPPAATSNTNGITVTWKSVGGINYNLQRSGGILAPVNFSTIQSNIIGQTNTTSYEDTSATNNFPYFYRVGVLAP